jgi:hypothetical protein
MAASFEIDLPWPVARAGYEVRRTSWIGNTILTRGPHEDVVIVPKSGNRRFEEPFRANPALFLRFAALDESSEACADFASRFGLLHRTRRAADGERFALWREHLRRFKRLADLWREGGASHLLRRASPSDLPHPAIMHVGLTWVGERPALVLVPESLLAGLELQLAVAVAGGSEIRACDQCGIFFERGRGKQRRAQARFCSDICRFEFHNARKREGASS